MKNYFYYLIIAMAFSFIVSGCEKAPYLTDEGLHDPNIEVSKVEFLERNSWQLFDTLVLLIDHHNMREEVNNAPTFFAATDYSFERYANQPLDTLYKRIPADTLRDYIFNEKITLKQLVEEGTPINVTSTSGKSFQVFTRTDNDFFSGERWSSVEPDFLYLTKVVGEGVDPAGIDPATIPPNERDIDVRMQTQGIIDPSGNILHVLSNQHQIGFN